MKMHPREAKVTEAWLALTKAMHKWYRSPEAEELTDSEFYFVMAGVLGDAIASYAKYQIREERHPDNPNKPGGLA